MLRNKMKGKVIVIVRDKYEKIKRYRWREIIWNAIRYFKFQIQMVAINHNIVTDEGDAMIADLMAETPA